MGNSKNTIAEVFQIIIFTILYLPFTIFTVAIFAVLSTISNAVEQFKTEENNYGHDNL